MALVNFNVACKTELFGKIHQLNLQLNLVPKDEWRQFVIVLRRSQDAVPCISLFLLNFPELLACLDLLQLFLALKARSSGVDELLAVGMDFLDVFTLPRDFGLAQFLEEVHRLFVDLKPVT